MTASTKILSIQNDSVQSFNSVHSTLKSKEFADRLEQIAVIGSGIPSALWKLNTEILINEEIDHGGDVSHPLYDALGWNFARFSYRANEKSKEFGIAVRGLGGEVWQVVLPDDTPKGYRYIAPKGIGNRVFFPALDPESLAKIGERYGITPDPVDYWKQFKALGLPLMVTEGAKKALAAIGQGVICCAVYGNACLKSPDLEGWTNIQVAMDQDSGFDSKGRSKRQKTIAHTLASAKYLRARGHEVSFIVWDVKVGKGLDDLLVSSPAKFWDAVDNPTPKLISIESKIKTWKDSDFDYIAKSKAELENLLATLEGVIFVDGATGTGKTETLISLTSNPNLSQIAVTPLRSLCFGVANTLDLAIFNDGHRGEIDDRVSVVINSLHKVRPLRAYNLYLDEFEQSLDNLYRGKLCRKSRGIRIQGFERSVKGADKVILLSATALPNDVQKIESIRGERAKRIRYSPKAHPKPALMITHGNGEPGASGTANALVIQSLASDIQGGQRAIVACDTARDALQVGLLGEAWGLAKSEILIYSQESISDPRIQDFRKAPNKGEWLAKHQIKLLSYSPVMTSGDSIKNPPGKTLFDSRYAFITGKSIAPAQALQLINRYRSSLPINMFVAEKGRFLPLVRGGSEDALRLGRTLAPGGFLIDDYALGNDRRLDGEYGQYLESFVAWAERDGHSVAFDPTGKIPEIKRENLDEQIAQWRATPIQNATPITDDRAKTIRGIPEPTIADTLSLRAWEIRQWHGLTWDSPLTIDQITEEGFGRKTQKFRKLLELAIEGKATETDRRRWEEIGDSPYLHDLPYAESRLTLWERLGIIEILQYCLKNPYSINDPTLRSWWDGLWNFGGDFQKYPKLLGFTFRPHEQGDYSQMVSTIGLILSSIGLKTISHRSRPQDLARVYQIDPESWEATAQRLARYLKESGEETRSTALGRIILSPVDQSSEIPLKMEKIITSPPEKPDPPPPKT
jgi:hypothetical protein